MLVEHFAPEVEAGGTGQRPAPEERGGEAPVVRNQGPNPERGIFEWKTQGMKNNGIDIS